MHLEAQNLHANYTPNSKIIAHHAEFGCSLGASASMLQGWDACSGFIACCMLSTVTLFGARPPISCTDQRTKPAFARLQAKKSSQFFPSKDGRTGIYPNTGRLVGCVRDFALARDSTNALVSVAAKPAPAAWRFYWRSEEKGMLLCSFTGMEFQALSLRGLRVRLQD